MRQDLAPVTPARFAALAFLIFAALVFLTMIILLVYPPPESDPSITIAALIFFLVVCTSALLAAWQLWMRQQMWIAFLLVGFLTFTIVGGWLKFRTVDLEDPLPPHVNALRTLDGLYVLLLWPILIAAHWARKSSDKSQGENGDASQ